MDKYFEFDTCQYTLLVSDADICKALAEAKHCCENIGQCITEIKGIVGGTSDYWTTSSAELLRERFAEDISSQEFSESSVSGACDALDSVISSYQSSKDSANKAEALADNIFG